MNPPYPTEAVPLHEWRNNMFTGQQPAVPTVVQNTIVNMVTDPPKDHTIWSLWSFVYGNICCLGLVALIFSVKARDRKVVGDLNGAKKYGSTAWTFNVIATVLAGLMFCILIIFFVGLNGYWR